MSENGRNGGGTARIIQWIVSGLGALLLAMGGLMIQAVRSDQSELRERMNINGNRITSLEANALASRDGQQDIKVRLTRIEEKVDALTPGRWRDRDR
jgi:hypothetical protein